MLWGGVGGTWKLAVLLENWGVLVPLLPLPTPRSIVCPSLPCFEPQELIPCITRFPLHTYNWHTTGVGQLEAEWWEREAREVLSLLRHPVSDNICNPQNYISQWEAPPLWVHLPSDFSQFSSVQWFSRVWLFVTPARQASLSITISWSSLRLTSIESVMPFSHLILCHPILLLPPIPPSIRVFSNDSTLPHQT